MRWLIAASCLAGCGRIGFDAVEIAAGPHLELRVDRIAPGEPLVDFPLLVVLDGRVDAATLAAGPRFFEADGVELAAELEDPGHAWVRVPLVQDTTTTITVRSRPHGDGPARGKARMEPHRGAGVQWCR